MMMINDYRYNILFYISHVRFKGLNINGSIDYTAFGLLLVLNIVFFIALNINNFFYFLLSKTNVPFLSGIRGSYY